MDSFGVLRWGKCWLRKMKSIMKTTWFWYSTAQIKSYFLSAWNAASATFSPKIIAPWLMIFLTVSQNTGKYLRFRTHNICLALLSGYRVRLLEVGNKPHTAIVALLFVTKSSNVELVAKLLSLSAMLLVAVCNCMMSFRQQVRILPISRHAFLLLN